MKRRLRDPVPSAEFRDLGAGLVLVQHADDLRFGESTFRISPPRAEDRHNIWISVRGSRQDEVRAHPQHPMRAQFDKVLGEFIENLRTSPEVIARAEAMKDKLLDQPVVAELTDSIWESTRRSISKCAGPDAPSPEPVARTIVTLAESLLENHDLRHELDEAVCNLAIGVIEQHREEVGALIARTVAGWDVDAASEKIEIAVGKDLQYIRINGTLVGGLVGLLLFLLSAGFDRFGG